MNRVTATAAGLGVLGLATTGAYLGLVTGRLTVDLGIGRRTRPLGPLTAAITAPPEVVYDVATAPYAERRPRDLREKVEILERSEGMVLAAHRTQVRRGLVAVTVETVTFQPPRRIGFRLVRGPVPHVAETFELEKTVTGTLLTYTGEMGTDLGAVGERWGDLVQRAWVRAVADSVATITAEAQRRAALDRSTDAVQPEGEAP